MALGMVRDKKTGRKRRVDTKRSRAAKKGARSRRNKKLSVAVRKKIAKGVRKANRSGKTHSGRRVIRRASSSRTATRGRGRPAKKRHGNAGVPKSAAHRKAISAALRRYHAGSKRRRSRR